MLTILPTSHLQGSYRRPLVLRCTQCLRSLVWDCRKASSSPSFPWSDRRLRTATTGPNCRSPGSSALRRFPPGMPGLRSRERDCRTFSSWTSNRLRGHIPCRASRCSTCHQPGTFSPVSQHQDRLCLHSGRWGCHSCVSLLARPFGGRKFQIGTRFPSFLGTKIMYERKGTMPMA